MALIQTGGFEMYGKLEVGQQALIIGCRDPKNSWVIGKVVVIRALLSIGEAIPDDLLVPPYVGSDLICKCDGAIVEGLTFTPALIADHTLINVKHLMPLPPLKEKQIEKRRELCYD
jgi:hypothetical protein